MKFLIFLLCRFNLYAHPEQEQRIQALELRVKQLESMNNVGTNSGGLKTTNMNNTKINSGGTNVKTDFKITPEQRKQLEESLEKIKEMKQKQNEMLKELEKEGY